MLMLGADAADAPPFHTNPTMASRPAQDAPSPSVQFHGANAKNCVGIGALNPEIEGDHAVGCALGPCQGKGNTIIMMSLLSAPPLAQPSKAAPQSAPRRRPTAATDPAHLFKAVGLYICGG